MSNRQLGIGLILAGVFLLSYWGAHTYLRYLSLTLETTQTVTPTTTPEKPINITISGKVDIAVTDAVLNGKRWSVWSDKATYLPTSATVGEAGNMVIYGHNKASVFGNLRQVKPADEIVVTTASGQSRRYKVEDTQVVNPSQIELLRPTTYEVLTLYTCTGFLDSQRFVVRAKPVT